MNEFDLLVRALRDIKAKRAAKNAYFIKSVSKSRRNTTGKPTTRQNPKNEKTTLLAKAELKMHQGALTGRDFQRLDVAIRHNLTIDPSLKAKILA